MKNNSELFSDIPAHLKAYENKVLGINPNSDLWRKVDLHTSAQGHPGTWNKHLSKCESQYKRRLTPDRPNKRLKQNERVIGISYKNGKVIREVITTQEMESIEQSKHQIEQSEKPLLYSGLVVNGEQIMTVTNVFSQF